MTPNPSPEQYVFQAGRYHLTWSTGCPLIMGIVNVTPDSFSDGGLASTTSSALNHAAHLLRAGAHILDIGGESTRPGAKLVSAEQEWQRIGGIVKELITWNVPISVDTMKPPVMKKALNLGVDIINDVNGFRAEGAVDCFAQFKAGGVVMHMQGQPETMQNNPAYQSIVTDVYDFLQQRINVMTDAGVHHASILVDPGFGFGKSFEHNSQLFHTLSKFKALGAGVLVGVSRKSMIGSIIQQTDPADRVTGSVAAALLAAQAGACAIRVHDVKQTVEALKVLQWATLPTPAWPNVALVCSPAR